MNVSGRFSLRMWLIIGIIIVLALLMLLAGAMLEASHTSLLAGVMSPKALFPGH